MMEIIAIMVIIIAAGGAIAYLVHAKRKGVRCVGCPHAGSCSGHGSAGKVAKNVSHCR